MGDRPAFGTPRERLHSKLTPVALPVARGAAFLCVCPCAAMSMRYVANLQPAGPICSSRATRAIRARPVPFPSAKGPPEGVGPARTAQHASAPLSPHARACPRAAPAGAFHIHTRCNGESCNLPGSRFFVFSTPWKDQPEKRGVRNEKNIVRFGSGEWALQEQTGATRANTCVAGSTWLWGQGAVAVSM